MPRTNPNMVEAEVLAYVRAAERYGFCNNDRGTADAIHNAQVVHQYFTETWKEDLTDANFDHVVENLRPHLKFYGTPADAEYDKLVDDLVKTGQFNEAQFNEWYNRSGLVDKPQSRVAILTWLKSHGMQFTPEKYQFSIGQARVLHFLEFKHQSQTSGKPSHSATDDGSPFVSAKDANKPLWLRKREEREAQETQQITHTKKAEKDAWQLIAEKHAEHGNTHSERQEVQGRFKYLRDQGLSWRETAMAMERFVVELKRRAAVINRSVQ